MQTNRVLQLSAAGLVFLALLEGFAPPYVDQGGVATNGFGNTHNATKPVTVPQALKQLKINTDEAGRAVSKCITAPMNQNQYDAFTSFTFNVGATSFCGSTLVKKFNAGDVVGACNELPRWNRVAGKVNKGLIARREQERQLCLNED